MHIILRLKRFYSILFNLKCKKTYIYNMNSRKSTRNMHKETGYKHNDLIDETTQTELLTKTNKKIKIKQNTTIKKEKIVMNNIKKKEVVKDWEGILEGIKRMREKKDADVDTMGAETFYDPNLPKHITRFHILLAAMLSSQTKDPVVYGAMSRLKELHQPLTIEKVMTMKHQELALLLRPVGFYNLKAKYILQTCEILQKNHTNTCFNYIDIPSTFEELMALPGVGPKMAYLIMTCAWNKTVGICVDIHVHRISNRLGWVNTWKAKSNAPEKTREELQSWLPREYWGPINHLLVGFGQTICTPLRPKCDLCQINQLCPSAFKNKI